MIPGEILSARQFHTHTGLSDSRAQCTVQFYPNAHRSPLPAYRTMVETIERSCTCVFHEKHQSHEFGCTFVNQTSNFLNQRKLIYLVLNLFLLLRISI